MASQTPQRPFWSGTAERLSPVWTLTKAGKTAECVVWSHQFGFELRLAITDDPLPRTQVCQQAELVSLQEEWRAALTSKGWA